MTWDNPGWAQAAREYASEVPKDPLPLRNGKLAPDIRLVPSPSEDKPPERLPYIDMSGWDTTPAPEREWAVEHRIPMYQTHLTTGHGAIGKSLLELQRAVAHVLGKPWLGLPVRQGPAIYLGA